MGNIQLLHSLNTAQAGDLAGHVQAGSLEHGLPGIVIGTGHVVVGMVTGDDHQRTQDNLGVAGGLDSLNDVLASGLLGLALNGANEDILVAQVLHLGLHLAVGHLGDMGSAMAHEDKSSAVLSGLLGALVAGLFQSGSDNSLGNGFLVGIDDGGIGADLTQHGLGNHDGLDLVLVLLQSLAHLVVLSAVHQVGGLHNQSLHTVGNRTVHSLFHVIDLLAVTGLDVVDDDLCGEGAADGPVGESLGQSILNALDVFHTAVVEGSTEGDDQQLLLADLVLIPGIIQRSIAGIAAEVLGAGLFALDQLLLSIGQGVPGSLGGLALGVCLVVAGLDIDGVEALDLVRKEKPDIVLLDIKMPRLDGIHAARMIGHEGLAPVLLLTAYSQQDIVDKAKDSGVLGYLVKPVSPVNLFPAIEIAISQFRHQREVAQQLDDMNERIETRKAVDRAKGCLMDLYHISEHEAYRRLQQYSMKNRKSLKAVADAVVASAEKIKSQKK